MTDESIEVKIARIETLLLSMDERLFGNGQPGVIANMQEEIDGLKESRDNAKGAIRILAFLAGAVGLTQLIQFFHRS